MRIINLIVVHCSATREDCILSPEDLDRLHRRRLTEQAITLHPQGRNGAPYLPVERTVYTPSFNAHSIGICYEGGLDCRGRPADTRTPAQRATLRQLVGQLQEKFSGCRVCGHRDLSPDLNGNGEIEPEEWIKQCPCFDVAKEFKEFGEFADRTDETGSTEKHRVTQHIKEQKGGK